MLFLARANKETRIQECYNLFEKYDWDLTKFKNDTDLFVDAVRESAREYAETVLNETLTKEKIWCLMPRNIRILFTEYDAIIKEMLKAQVISRSQLMDIGWMIENLKPLLCEFCYNISERYNWVNSDIDEYCATHGILNTALKGFARDYRKEVLKWDEEKEAEHWQKKVSLRKDYNFSNISEEDGLVAKLYMQLREAKTEQEIIKIFTDFNRPYYNIRHGLTNFVTSYNVPNEIRDEIFGKLKIYNDHLTTDRNQTKEQEKEEEKNGKIKIATEVISAYARSDFESVGDYCNNVNLERKVFDKHLALVKENDEKTYNEFLQHEENIKNRVRDDLVSRTLKVIDMMKNGVVENGLKREFDLTDYYRYLPLGFDKMLRIVRDSINPEDYRNLGIYIGTIKNDKELSENDINGIYTMKTTVGVQFDNENKAIPGTGREITISEKQNIINYLKTNNIPVTNKTYDLVYRKWLSGNLVIEQEKDKKK